MERIFSIQKGMIVILLMFLTFACSTSKSMIRDEAQSINPDLPFEISLLSNHRDNTYQVGEDIHFLFSSNKDCYMTLVNIDKGCKVRILLPNQSQKENEAKAGFIYRIPSQSAKFRFKARVPGEEIVRAIATLEDIPLFDLKSVKADGPFREVVMCRDIFEEELSTKLNSLAPGEWAEYQMTLKIVNQKP